MKPQVFFKITKVDATTHEVTGLMTEEITDKSKEKMDYDSSKPRFQKWSAGIAKATGGKSLGNVRWMHQPIIGGKISAMMFNDADKAISITTIPVDDETFRKIDEGFASGFSIGGNLIGKLWADPDEPGVMRYTIDPVEVSYVDNPCLTTATFTSVKLDGTSITKAFKMAYEPTNDEVFAEAGRIVGVGGEMTDVVFSQARDALVAKHAGVAPAAPVAPEVINAPVAKETPAVPPVPAVTPPPVTETPAPAAVPPEPVVEAPAEPKEAAASVDFGIDQVFQVRADKSVHATKGAAKAHVAASQTIIAGNSPLAAQLLAAIAKAQGAAPAVTLFADPGIQADGLKRYPIDTPLHVRSSWYLFEKAVSAGSYDNPTENGVDRYSEVDLAITAAWKEKVDAAGPPPAEAIHLLDAAAYTDLVEKLTPLTVAKGMYTVSDLAQQLRNFGYIVQEVCWEADYEADGSALPTTATTIMAAMASFLIDMVNEEVAELLAGLPMVDVVEVMEMAATAGVAKAAEAMIRVTKANEPLMTKAGARNSKKDKKSLQDIHDNATAMGAKCDGGNVDKSAGGEVQKLVAERDEMAETIKAVLPEVQKMGETITKLSADLVAAQDQIAKLSAEPAPMPGMQAGTRAVEKTVDTAPHTSTPAPATLTDAASLAVAIAQNPAMMKMLQEAAFDSAMGKPVHVPVGLSNGA